MSDAPKRICINDFGEWYALDDGEAPGALREYIRHDAPELVALVKAANQARLAFAGYVSADSAIRKLDDALAAWEKINDR